MFGGLTRFGEVLRFKVQNSEAPSRVGDLEIISVFRGVSRVRSPLVPIP